MTREDKLCVMTALFLVGREQITGNDIQNAIECAAEVERGIRELLDYSERSGTENLVLGE
jgi:hypothetical protein